MDQILGKRRRVVRVSPELLTEWLTEGWQVPQNGRKSIKCVQGLPEGAVFLTATKPVLEDYIEFTFVHSDWESIPWGTPPPVLEVHYQAENELQE